MDSAKNNENKDTVPNNDTLPNKTSANDEPEQNTDANKEDNPKQDKDNTKDESLKNNNEDTKKDDVSNISESDKDLDEDYFSVGYFLKEDGTLEEIKLHVSEMTLDSDEELEEEDFDDLNPPYHFAEDGSIQKLDLKKESPKKTPEVSSLSKARTVSLGHFRKMDGTIEEVRISLYELESDSENETDEEESLEGISTTYHLGEDGSLQTLLEDKSASKDKGKTVNDGKNSSEDQNPLDDNDASNEKNKPNKIYEVNDKIITINDKNKSDGKNPFYDND